MATALTLFHLIKRIGHLTKRLNDPKLLDPAINRFVNENMGRANITDFYNNDQLKKFKYRHDFKAPYYNTSDKFPGPVYDRKYLFNSIKGRLIKKPIPPQPKCIREAAINKILCSAIANMKRKKRRELTEMDAKEFDLGLIERMVDFEYNEHEKKNLLKRREPVDVMQVIKEAGILV